MNPPIIPTNEETAKASNKYSIKCSSCAAPLTILGGGRISTVTCEYCNAVLDMNNNYAVLSKFMNASRPDTPFKLGMTGHIKGVKWIIIGCVSYTSADEDDDNWSEYFLYSATHGYAWLVYEAGKLSFSKRVRDFDLFAWQKNTSAKTTFYQKGHYLLTEAPYTVYIDISIEKSKEEIEVSLTEPLDTSKVYQSFGISKEDIKDYYQEEKAIKFSKRTFISIFILIFTMIFSGIPGSTVYSHSPSGNPITLDVNRSFTVTKSSFIGHINIKANDEKENLQKFSLILYKAGKPYFSLKENKISSKDIFKNNIKKEANVIDIYLHLDEGKYDIRLNQASKVSIRIRQGIVRLKYIIIMLFLYILYGIINLLLSYRFSKRFLYRTLAVILGLWLFGIGGVITLASAYYIFKRFAGKDA